MQTKRGISPAAILSGLTILAVVAALIFLMASQNSRARSLASSGVDAEIQAATGLRFDGITVPISASGFSVSDADGRQRALKLETSSQHIAIQQTDFLGELAFAATPQTATVTATIDQSVEFSGSFEEFKQFVPQKNGEYGFEVTAAFQTERYTGTCSYSFSVVYEVTTDFYLTKTEVAQGDAILLVGVNLRNHDVAVSLDFDYTPYLVYNKTGCVGYIPINYMREAGQHKATVTYADTEQQFYYTVTEPDFDEQHLTVPESTRQATVENNDAQKEYSAVMDAADASFDDTVYWTQPFIQPVAGTITTEFGIKRYTNGAATPTRHAGIDIACATGTPVAAANTGKVIYSGYLDMTGNTVIIEHGMGVHSIYLHMDSLNCASGDIVSRGDTIGTVGETGYATGPHLHFEMQIGGYCINPWLAFDETGGLYDLQISDFSEAQVLP